MAELPSIGCLNASHCFTSNSLKLLWKSDETTHKILSAVIKASKFPFGEGAIAENGPRESRISVGPETESKLKTVLDDVGETSSCVKPEDELSGGTTFHADGREPEGDMPVGSEGKT